MTTRIGPAGWSYPDWEGTVYPQPHPKKFDALAFLAGIFDTIEINSSFYRPVAPRTADSWVRRVVHNPRFKFTAKVWQRLTHEAGVFSPQDALEFAVGLRPLADAGLLGALLLQFPWSFKYGAEQLLRLEQLSDALRAFPLVLEVRHASWNDARFHDFLRQRSLGLCNIDQPVIGQSLRPAAVVTSPIGYFRLHGRNYKEWFRADAGRDNRYDYLYSPGELDQLTDLIRQVEDASAEAYAITNNHFRGKAVCNAAELQERLTGKKPELPPSLIREYPRLAFARDT